MGIKRNIISDPETGGLSHNAEVTHARVEHIIGEKQYAPVRKRYGDTLKQFSDEINGDIRLVNSKPRFPDDTSGGLANLGCSLEPPTHKIYNITPRGHIYHLVYHAIMMPVWPLPPQGLPL